MSTYCISDIHGNLREFKSMLVEIGFKYDGSDRLIIMGDMVDWGKESIETLMFCMGLDKEYDFIDVLMGNHELMMLEDIEKRQGEFIGEYFPITNWGRNGGIWTLEGYLKLDKETREKIKRWLCNLRYFLKDVEVGGNRFYITHSSPYMKKPDFRTMGYKNNFEKMLWERVNIGDNVLKNLLNDDKSILVHGHTITKNYGSLDGNGKSKVYYELDNQRICIDCGAKVFGYRNYGRLACIRLDDMKEYYVDYQESVG